MHSDKFIYQGWTRWVNIISKQTIDDIVNLKFSFLIAAVGNGLLYTSVIYNTGYLSNFFKQVIVRTMTALQYKHINNKSQNLHSQTHDLNFYYKMQKYGVTSRQWPIRVKWPMF